MIILKKMWPQCHLRGLRGVISKRREKDRKIQEQDPDVANWAFEIEVLVQNSDGNNVDREQKKKELFEVSVPSVYSHFRNQSNIQLELTQNQDYTPEFVGIGLLIGRYIWIPRKVSNFCTDTILLFASPYRKVYLESCPWIRSL